MNKRTLRSHTCGERKKKIKTLDEHVTIGKEHFISMIYNKFIKMSVSISGQMCLKCLMNKPVHEDTFIFSHDHIKCAQSIMFLQCIPGIDIKQENVKTEDVYDSSDEDDDYIYI